MRSTAIAFLVITLCLANAFSQDESLFHKKTYHSPEGDSLLYRILFPVGYSPEALYPVLFFMHGAGERGSDNESQLVHGSDLFLDGDNRINFPAIVVFPQCPADRYWVNYDLIEKIRSGDELNYKEVKELPSRELQLVMELLDEILADERADSKRIYLMGLSMGGFAIFDMLSRWPDIFTAAVPICGGGNPKLTRRYSGKVSIWITHGAKDNVVPVKYSRDIYAALKRRKADVNYTEFPDAGHNAWDPTFAIPELLPWLFSKTK